MKEWKSTKMGELINDGVLRVTLFEEGPRTWDVFLYPRVGVTLKTSAGSVMDWACRLAVIRIEGRTRDYAREQALEVARKWLDENLDALLGEE